MSVSVCGISKLTCALASHAPRRRHALLGLHLFSLRGEGAEATRAVPHRSPAPPPRTPPFLSQNKRRQPGVLTPPPPSRSGAAEASVAPLSRPKLARAERADPAALMQPLADPRGARGSAFDVISFAGDAMTTARRACPSIETVEEGPLANVRDAVRVRACVRPWLRACHSPCGSWILRILPRGPGTVTRSSVIAPRLIPRVSSDQSARAFACVRVALDVCPRAGIQSEDRIHSSRF